MSRTYGKYMLLAFILSASFVCLFSIPHVCKIMRRHGLMREGQVIIGQIETYKEKNGHLPVKLEEVNTNATEIYYQTKNETNYILWFGEGLGESVTYYSDERQWR